MAEPTIWEVFGLVPRELEVGAPPGRRVSQLSSRLEIQQRTQKPGRGVFKTAAGKWRFRVFRHYLKHTSGFYATEDEAREAREVCVASLEEPIPGGGVKADLLHWIEVHAERRKGQADKAAVRRVKEG